MTTMQKRKPRFRREEGVKLQLQERDDRIIRLVYKHRFLTSEHIRALIPGSRKGTLRRLHLLYHAGYLDRPREQIKAYRRGSEPMVYGLGNKGAERLAEKYEIPRSKVDWTSKNREVKKVYLDHTLAVSHFMVCLKLACDQDPRVEFIEPREILEKAPGKEQKIFPGWKVTVEKEEKKVNLSILPDKVFGLYYPREDKRSYFMLEADRSTMPIKREGFTKTSIYKKLLGYQESWKQGLYPKVYGFKAVRVLFVTKSTARIASMINICKEMDSRKEGFRMFLFAHNALLDLEKPKTLLDGIWRNGRDEVVNLF